MIITRLKRFTGCLSPINVYVEGYGSHSFKNGECKYYHVDKDTKIIVDVYSGFSMHQMTYQVNKDQNVEIYCQFGGIVIVNIE